MTIGYASSTPSGVLAHKACKDPLYFNDMDPISRKQGEARNEALAVQCSIILGIIHPIFEGAQSSQNDNARQKKAPNTQHGHYLQGFIREDVRGRFESKFSDGRGEPVQVSYSKGSSKPGRSRRSRAALRQCAYVRHPASLRLRKDTRAVFHHMHHRIRSISFSSNAGVHSSAA